MYEIHHAKLELGNNDIPCIECKSIEDVRSYITSILYPLKTVADRVYLLAIQDEVIVTDNYAFVEELFDGNINSVYPFYENEKIFIQEYESYEEAYDAALMMREGSELCYSKETGDISKLMFGDKNK